MKRVCFIVVTALVAGFSWAALNRIAQFDTGLDQRKLDLGINDVAFLTAVLNDNAVKEKCAGYFDLSTLETIKECDPANEFVADDKKKASICHIGAHSVGSQPKKVELQLEKESFKFIIEVDSIFDSTKKTFADFFEIAHYFVYFCTKQVATISAAEIQKVLTELAVSLNVDKLLPFNISELKIVQAEPASEGKGTIGLTLKEAHKIHEQINPKIAIPPLHYAITTDKSPNGGNPAAGIVKLTIKGPYSSNSIVYTIPNPEFIKEQTKEFLLNSIRDYERMIRFIKNYKRGLASHALVLTDAAIKEIIGDQLKAFNPGFEWLPDASKITVACPETANIKFSLAVANGGTFPGSTTGVPQYYIVTFFRDSSEPGTVNPRPPKLEDSVANLEMVVPDKSYYDHTPFLQAFAEDAVKQLKVMCSK